MIQEKTSDLIISAGEFIIKKIDKFWPTVLVFLLGLTCGYIWAWVSS